DDRVVVVDEQRAQWRIDIVFDKMPADVVDRQRASAGGQQIRALQPGGSLGKGVARGQYDAAALAELAEQSRQGDRRADAAAAVAAAFEAVAWRQNERFGLGKPAREGQDLAFLQPAGRGCSCRGPLPGARHELLEAQYIGGDEEVIQRSRPLELGGDGPGEQDIGAGQQLQMQIRLLGDLCAKRVDDDQLAAPALCPANGPDEVQVGDRRVVAPDDIELGVLGEFGRASGYGTISSRPGLAADAAAQRPPVELGGAEAVEEPQGHAVPGEKAVRAGIVQRHHRLRSPSTGDGADPLVNLVQSFLPRDTPELARTLGPDAAQRVKQALASVDEVGGIARHLVADDAGGIGRRTGAAHLYYAAVIDVDRQAAGVGAIEGTHTCALIEGHKNPPCEINSLVPNRSRYATVCR